MSCQEFRLGRWFSTGVTLHPRTFGSVWGHSQLGKRVLLASSEERPEMLLNILQCTTQSPRQRPIWPQMSKVLRLRIPLCGTHQFRIRLFTPVYLHIVTYCWTSCLSHLWFQHPTKYLVWSKGSLNERWGKGQGGREGERKEEKEWQKKISGLPGG